MSLVKGHSFRGPPSAKIALNFSEFTVECVHSKPTPNTSKASNISKFKQQENECLSGIKLFQLLVSTSSNQDQ